MSLKMLLKERIITLGEDDYKINIVPFSHLAKLASKGFEGICFLGTGGELKEWINGINDLLNQEGVGQGTTQDKFQGVYSTKTSGGRIDLILIFKSKSTAVNIGKMAMWRLRFGDTSWLSDYVVNYKNQHESKQPSKMKLTLEERKLVKEYITKLVNEEKDLPPRTPRLITMWAYDSDLVHGFKNTVVVYNTSESGEPGALNADNEMAGDAYEVVAAILKQFPKTKLIQGSSDGLKRKYIPSLKDACLKANIKFEMQK